MVELIVGIIIVWFAGKCWWTWWNFNQWIALAFPLLILFAWLRSTFAETAIAGTWLWWYIGTSIAFSIVIRKLFGLQ